MKYYFHNLIDENFQTIHLNFFCQSEFIIKVKQKIVKLLEIFIFIIKDNVNDNKVKNKLPDIIYLDLNKFYKKYEYDLFTVNIRNQEKNRI